MVMASPGSSLAVLLSGGLDSAILLGRMLEQGREVQPLYVRSGHLWEEEEFEAACRLLGRLRSPRLRPLVVLEAPVEDLYSGHWSLSGVATPGADSPDEAVFLPGRNALLLVKAGLWCQLHGVGAVALGCLEGNPFGDATAEFCEALETALNLGGGRRVRIERPFAALSKSQVMRLGRALPLEVTFSCLRPAARLHCGECNKCGERRRAFAAIGRPDKTRYARPAPVPLGSE